jgi:FKBP-type peptidyl-prolyl cis-trans isomerase FkpA
MDYTKALNTVIEGWQIGMPLIKKGGRIKLIIPSSYGYGCIEKGNIPPNSVLYYDVYLANVQ